MFAARLPFCMVSNAPLYEPVLCSGVNVTLTDTSLFAGRNCYAAVRFCCKVMVIDGNAETVSLLTSPVFLIVTVFTFAPEKSSAKFQNQSDPVKPQSKQTDGSPEGSGEELSIFKASGV